MMFLIELASDPERMRRYAANPAAEIDGAGLSPDESAALVGGDVRRLRQALNASPVDHMTTMGGGGGHGGPGGPGGSQGHGPHGKRPGRKKTSYGKKKAAKKKTAKKKSARKGTAKKSKRSTR